MKNDIPKDISPHQLEALLREAAAREGACVPESPSELSALEEKLVGQTIDLPEFSDLLAKIRRKIPQPMNVIHVTLESDSEVAADLAMAARNGGDIPDAVRDQMDSDRAEAEAEKA
jgi:hypothetical protein